MAHQHGYKDLDQVLQEIDELLAAAPADPTTTAAPASVDPSSVRHRFLLVAAGDLEFAVPMADIGEIGTLPVITPLPGLPSWLAGIVNLRGEIVSVTNLAAFLGVAAAHPGGGSRFVLLRHGRVRTMIAIDRMHGTVDKTVAELHLPAPPGFVAPEMQGCVRPGFMAADRPYPVLDVGAVLSSRRFLDYRR